MATVLESLAIPRASALPKPSFVSASSSSSSSICSFDRKSVALPQAKGLKVGFFTAARSGASVAIRRPIRSSRIVCEAQDTAVEVPAVTDATWQSLVLDSEAPVLVEFWAPWCGPCRMIHPVIGELAKQYTGKLKCCKVNTDDSPAIATKYGIRSIPTVIIFKNGEKKDAIIGAVQKSILINSIEKFL